MAEQPRAGRARAVGLLVAGALLLAAAATGAGPFLRADRDFVGRPFRVPRPLRIGDGSGGGGELPAGLRRAGDVAEVVLVVLTSAVLLALATAVLVVFVRGLARLRLLRARSDDAAMVDAYDGGEAVDDEGTEPLRRRLARELDLGGAALASGDPDEAVIACYLAMVAALAAGGTEARPHETPGELVERALAAHRVTPAAIGRLTELYREARYSRHPMDERRRAAARAALADVRRELVS